MKEKDVYNLGEIDFKDRSESNTSIDTLINYPFDYTAQYIAKLSEPSNKDMGSIQKVTGLVAHLVIQNLVNDTKEEKDCIGAMEKLIENKDEFTTRLEAAVKATGLILFLKENEVEYNQLPHLLKKSIKTLIEIMKKKGLTPVGCELKYEKPLGGPIDLFNARIDMELKDSHDNAVIFDFKWSYSKYYGEKIQNGKALQLELYRTELEKQGKKVAAVGYYLLPKCLLETPDYETDRNKEGKIIISHIEPPHDAILMEQIKNSVAERKEEIKAGEIEEGECQEITQLTYSHKLLCGANMLLVGKEKRGRVTKANPNPPIEAINKESQRVFTTKPEARFFKTYGGFDDKKAPSNEQPTTYPLMKGRLK